MPYEPLVDIFKEKVGKHSAKKMFVTSSFQSHSLPMLHLIAQFAPQLPVYFLNTGFHFSQTIAFKDQVAALLGLNVLDLVSPIPKIAQRDSQGLFFFVRDPDYCCHINKIMPVEPLLSQYEVWISGVRKDQNANRSNFEYEMEGKNGTLRLHPMLEWSKRDIAQYIKDHRLPRHPLEQQGYLSIGCEPCTRQSLSDRDGRWAGSLKTECGLHTELVSK
jgi:phosphoadenosine phosphosulfate reductase